MSIRIRFQSAGYGLTLAVVAAAALLPSTIRAGAHIVPIADMIRGIKFTQAQCAAIPETVWLRVSNQDFCIRYYLSTVGGSAPRPVVFLQGDKLGPFNPKTGVFDLKPTDKDIDTDRLARSTDNLSRRFKSTAIYLARVGIDGSSGDHRIRHSVLELYVTNAALDAIKKRHGFDGFHLIGQSGGSKLVGGMLALRGDIGCAVIGAGSLARSNPNAPRRPQQNADPGRQGFVVADGVSIIAQRRQTRIILVTDLLDKKVPERTQTPFVQMLQQAGGRAEQYIVQATDENHHGVTPYAMMVAGECLAGTGAPELAQKVQQMVEKRLAAKAAKDATEAKEAQQTHTPAKGTSSNLPGPRASVPLAVTPSAPTNAQPPGTATAAAPLPAPPAPTKQSRMPVDGIDNPADSSR